jgi:hypothetical protein
MIEIRKREGRDVKIYYQWAAKPSPDPDPQ